MTCHAVAYAAALALLAPRMPNGVVLRLTRLNPDALRRYAAVWVSHPDRPRTWAWASLLHEMEREDPDLFDLAIWDGDRLCGLALGDSERAADHCSMWFLEGEPGRRHPLRGHLLDIAVTALVAYATALGRTEIRIVKPAAHVVRRLSVHQFTLVPVPGGPNYLRRSIEP